MAALTRCERACRLNNFPRRRTASQNPSLPCPALQAVTPPEAPADSGPADLGCLDHSYFRQETSRLLARARTLQLRLLQGSGRRSGGSAGGADASAALEAVVASLGIHDAELRREVPFQPEALLRDLYRLEGIVTACTAGSWAGDAGLGGSGGPAAHRLGAEDAADGEEWCEEEDSEDDGLDAAAERAGRRLSQGGRRRSGGNLAGSKSSGSLSGSGRRR